MQSVLVGHAKEPNFGLGPSPSYPEGYVLVAAVTVYETWTQEMMLEAAFQYTNSIDCGWWENEQVDFLLKTDGCRSTSVGDVVVLPDKRVFVCRPAGWEELKEGGK